MKQLDKYFPPCGEGAFCGHHDKRHRLWDAIMGNYDSRDSIKETAESYCLPIEAVKLVIELRPYEDEKV